MTITSTVQIAQLKACGVQTLVVRTNGENGEAVEAEPLSEPDIATDPVLTAGGEPAPIPQIVPFEEELPAARQIYHAAKQSCRMPCTTPGWDERLI